MIGGFNHTSIPFMSSRDSDVVCADFMCSCVLAGESKGRIGGEVHRRDRGRSSCRHLVETSQELRHRPRQPEVPDRLQPEHEHRPRAGDGPLQQTPHHNSRLSHQRQKSHQGLTLTTLFSDTTVRCDNMAVLVNVGFGCDVCRP